MASTLLVEIAKKVSRNLDDDKVLGSSIGALAVAWYLKSKFLTPKKPTRQPTEPTRKDKNDKKVDRRFWERFVYILNTCIPSPFCKVTLTATCLTLTLVMRTWASLLTSKMLGSFLQNFCSRKWPEVTRIIIFFTAITIPISGLNALLKFFTSALSTQIRERITKKVHELYMKDMNYYRSNKVGEQKLNHADQLIAEDIAKFSSQLSSVYSNLLKPLVDFVIFSYQMKKSLGNKGPLTMYFWFAFAAWISSIVMPAYWRLQIKSQELEGTFRARHKRLIESSEMIAFNGGETPEKKIIDDAYRSISSYSAYSNWKQLFSNISMGYLNKYAASSVGMTLVCLPIFLSKKYADYDASQIASFYVQCTRIMGGQAEAVLALFDLQKEIGQLAGLTIRVWELIYRLAHPEVLNLPSEEDNPPLFIESNTLTFKNVSIYKPDGTLLVKHLNFSVPKGTRVMITGENGCGKSSLFRVLRGLWPLCVGTICSPDRQSLKTFYFLSQANFVPIGSLRDILIYPKVKSDLEDVEQTDEELREVLRWSQVEMKVGETTLDFDTVMDWAAVLSPGVKQRMAFARLLYHRPLYAVLDECTNNIAPEVEIRLYNKCRELGITVFSISHKMELKKFHDFELNYDGKGGFSWIDLQINNHST